MGYSSLFQTYQGVGRSHGLGISKKSIWFIHSKNTVKIPRLVGFWEDSTQAFVAALYIVTIVSKTELQEGTNLPHGDEQDYNFDPDKYELVSNLLTAKARIFPLKSSLTILRSKHSGFYCVFVSSTSCVTI